MGSFNFGAAAAVDELEAGQSASAIVGTDHSGSEGGVSFGSAYKYFPPIKFITEIEGRTLFRNS